VVGNVVRMRANDSEGRTADPASIERALTLIAPLTAAPDASVALRRAHAHALWQHGFLLQRGRDLGRAVQSLEASRTLLRGIANLELSDPDAVAQYAEASAWLASAHGLSGRLDEAEAVATEGRAAASRLIEQRPTHYLALRARALLTGQLGDVAAHRMRQMDAYALILDQGRDWRTLASVDPSNAVSWNNLAVARNNAGARLRDAGRLSEAREVFRQNADVEVFARTRSLPSNILLYTHGQAAFVAGQQADKTAVREHHAAVRRYAQAFEATLAPGSFDREAFIAEMALIDYEIGFASDDAAMMREAAQTLERTIPALRPGNPQQQSRQQQLAGRMHFNLARSAVNRGDAVQTARHAQADLDIWKVRGVRTIEERQIVAISTTWLALALAAQGQRVEARQALEPALQFFRETDAANVDDAELRFYMARALYAQALTEPARARELFAEARARFDALPHDMRQAWTHRLWGDRFADAQRVLSSSVASRAAP
jgi:tetratricopeptide (TPR) repeat protein